MAENFDLSCKMNDAESKCLSCGAPLPEGREGQQKFTGGKLTVIVLGDDTEKSKKLYENVVKAVEDKMSAENVLYNTDREVANQYHIKQLPALIINGSIVSQGIVSDVDEIRDEIDFLY